MSKTEALISAIQRFWLTPRVIKLAFVLINSAYIFFIIGFFTNGWVSGGGSSYRQGLFSHCVVSGIFTCCRSLNSHLSDSNANAVPEWLSTTRIILGFCLIPSTVAVVTMYICSTVNFVTEGSRMKLYLERACYIASYISGACLLAGIAVYGENFGRDSWQSGAAVQFSYALTTMGGIFFVMAGIAFSASFSRPLVCRQQDQQGRRDGRYGREGRAEPTYRLRATYNSGQTSYRRQSIEMISPVRPTLFSPPSPSAPPSRPADEHLCCICLTEPVNSAFANCGHSSCCMDCANNLLASTMTCPICRQFIISVVRIYRT